MAASVDISAVIELEAVEDGEEPTNIAHSDQHARPTVDFARAAKRQRYDSDGKPILGQRGQQTGEKLPRTERFRVGGNSVFLTYAGLDPNEFTLAEVHEALKLKCKGGCAEIITCQELHPNHIFPAGTSQAQHKAILRRFVTVVVREPLFKSGSA